MSSQASKLQPLCIHMKHKHLYQRGNTKWIIILYGPLPTEWPDQQDLMGMDHINLGHLQPLLRDHATTADRPVTSLASALSQGSSTTTSRSPVPEMFIIPPWRKYQRESPSQLVRSLLINVLQLSCLILEHRILLLVGTLCYGVS